MANLYLPFWHAQGQPAPTRLFLPFWHAQAGRAQGTARLYVPSWHASRRQAAAPTGRLYLSTWHAMRRPSAVAATARLYLQAWHALGSPAAPPPTIALLHDPFWFASPAPPSPPGVAPLYLPFWHADQTAVILPIDLLAALKVVIEADAELTTALPGGYYLATAPPSSVNAPYLIVVEMPKATFLQTGRAARWSEDRYQFSVFAETAAAARILGNLVRSKLDYLVLEFQGGVMSDGLIPQGTPGLMREPNRGPRNRLRWQEFMVYKAHVNRPGR